MIRKSVIYVCCIMLLAMSVAALDLNILCDPVEVELGQTTTCDVKLNEMTTLNEVGFTINTPDGFTLLGVLQPSAAAFKTWSGAINLDNGKVAWGIATPQIINTDDYISQIVFTAGESGSGTVFLTNVVLKNPNGGIDVNKNPSQTISVATGPVLCGEGDWEYETTWSTCTKTCGGGTHAQAVVKKETSAGCVGEVGKLAPKVQHCNTQLCPSVCVSECEDDCEGTTLKTDASCSEGTCIYATSTPNSPTCGYVAPTETFPLTLLKARISSVLNENYEPEGTLDLTDYGFTDNKFEKVSKIASALKDYFNEG